jgi:CBS domain-containing protein
VASVQDFVTPAAELISLSEGETVNVAIAAMKAAGVRHIVVADKVSKARRLTEDSEVVGVINLQDVMSVIQRDERLSLISLAKKYPNNRDPML